MYYLSWDWRPAPLRRLSRLVWHELLLRRLLLHRWLSLHKLLPWVPLHILLLLRCPWWHKVGWKLLILLLRCVGLLKLASLLILRNVTICRLGWLSQVLAVWLHSLIAGHRILVLLLHQVFLLKSRVHRACPAWSTSQ